MKKVSHIHKVKVRVINTEKQFFCEIVVLKLHLISLLHYIKLSTWNIENAILLLLRLGKKTCKMRTKKLHFMFYKRPLRQEWTSINYTSKHFHSFCVFLICFTFRLKIVYLLPEWFHLCIWWVFQKPKKVSWNWKCIFNLLGSSLDDVNVFSTNGFLNLHDGFGIGLLKCRTSAKFDI